MLRRSLISTSVHGLAEPNGPDFSQLTFGTMRLDERVDGRPAAEFLCRLHDDGVDTHHSSFEYDTYPIYLDALTTAQATGRSFRHIVKLSCPSFDADRFDPSVLISRIDDELRSLSIEQVDCVQWLVRTRDATDERAQIQILSDQADEIDTTLNELIAQGKVRSFTSFPYSAAFASAVQSVEPVSGLCAYLNLLELDYADHANSGSFLALRPLAAGQLAKAAPVAEHIADVMEISPVAASLRFPLLHPNVTTVIASLRNDEQATSAIAALAATAPDHTMFDRVRHEAARIAATTIEGAPHAG